MRAAGALVGADGGGGGGGGTISLITSSDSSLTVASASGPTTDLVVGPPTTVSTAVSATTASLGLADIYRGTAASITITISSADITAGREFTLKAAAPGVSVGTPVTIATEGAETIEGLASVDLVVPGASITLYEFGGNLETR